MTYSHEQINAVSVELSRRAAELNLTSLDVWNHMVFDAWFMDAVVSPCIVVGLLLTAAIITFVGRNSNTATIGRQRILRGLNLLCVAILLNTVVYYCLHIPTTKQIEAKVLHNLVDELDASRAR